MIGEAATADPSRLVHQAGIYGSDGEFVATVVPFLREGTAAGEPTLVGVEPHEERLVRDTLGDTSALTFLPSDSYADPLLALKDHRELLAEHAKAGSVRLVGQIPQHQLETNWHGWVRHEAAWNHVYAALPVRTVCAYDSRRAPATVLADVERTHPRLAAPGGGSLFNELFADPAALLTDRMRGTPDPLEQTAPAVDLADPPVGTARDTVAGAAERTDLPRDDVDGLVLAVSEVVTNAYAHGARTVALRAWTAPHRVVVTVTDTGAGPDSPFVGLAPAAGEPGESGFGLWIAHQMCNRVDHVPQAGGFTIRLTAAPSRR